MAPLGLFPDKAICGDKAVRGYDPKKELGYSYVIIVQPVRPFHIFIFEVSTYSDFLTKEIVGCYT